ncbi:DUF58 domain-containing protein [Amnibacterium sp. CER49]|uniref:DUF58 domain-containing protein n=1 Tax=Amnibacterium sp. CER49 TaxID=3039161 RepID=UPI002449503F|nr:DUF58 domain-containing protein [Amnibacterium sp. CER49]MDH2444020.1 DUF58 domain-containing protein [Amnibacterium sp. CER49]
MTAPGDGWAWRRQGAPAGAAVTGVLLLAVGLVLAHPEIAVLGAPLVLLAAGSIRRPAGLAGVRTEVEGAGGSLRARVEVVAPAGVELVVVRVAAYGEPPRVLVVPPSHAVLDAALPVLHSGPQDVLRAEAALVAPAAAAVAVLPPAVARTTIGVDAEPLPALPLPSVLTGRPGSHTARRAGEGVEFRDLAVFTPGDRLRRIDWRATARLASVDLLVRRTAATAEAAAVILVDSRVDVGAVIAEWSRNRAGRKGRSALDVARSAAVSLAAAYLAAGDRVAFHDVASSARSVRSGGGRRQLERIRAAVAATSARDTGIVALPPLPSASVVLLLSTFLDDEPLRIARLQLAAGNRVLGIDVLPPADLRGADAHVRSAHRIVLLERTERLGRLGALGVEVVPWAGEDRAAALLAAARPGRR